MKETRTKLVACEYNEQGVCTNAIIVKNLTEIEYKKLINERNVEKAKQRQKEIDFEISYKKLCEKTSKSYILIAKLVYDSLVDRGYIDNDIEFENKWHNYITTGEPIDEFPTMIIKIAERLGAL